MAEVVKAMSMLELLKHIYPLRLAPNSPDTDICIEILKAQLPFEVHEYTPGEEHNGWVVPKSWEVKQAIIKKDGTLIYDGTHHPLGVMGYSQPFSGTLKLDELKQHLAYREDWPDAIGYHCDYYCKQWKSDWGFSVPHNLYKGLEDGEYEVDLEINYGDENMKVCDFFLPGERKDTIFFNAHNCHAAQANDDIAGCVVGIELMRRLSERKNKYSYRLIIAPEHLGTVFYLAHAKKEFINDFKYGFFLEMLGNDKRLAFQESFTGNSLIDRICHHHLKFHATDHFADKFRKIVGNDETVWEAPGFEIPTVSLSRYPYEQYHTSLDNEDIIREDILNNSVDIMMGMIEIFETNCTIKRKFDGLIALSNPKYDLYIAPGTDPLIKMDKTEDRTKWNYLMDCLPRYFDGTMTILDIAEKHDIDYALLYGYLLKFKDKGLIEFNKVRVRI